MRCGNVIKNESLSIYSAQLHTQKLKYKELGRSVTVSKVVHYKQSREIIVYFNEGNVAKYHVINYDNKGSFILTSEHIGLPIAEKNAV